MKNNHYFIIDFDSTFITTESLEELAEVSLRKNPRKDAVLKEIKKITEQGMNGEIPFSRSLARRLSLLSPTQEDVAKTSKVIAKKITPSIARNKNFFRKFSQNIYIISGGFKELIAPLVRQFHIPEDHILANTFIFSADGSLKSIDTANPLSQDDGKIKAVKSLNLKGQVYILGDGYTDYKLKESGLASQFIAFTENVDRPRVTQKADKAVKSFDEFLYLQKLPMTVSYPKSKIKVLLLENIHKDAVTIFEKEGYSVEYYDKSLPEEELKEKINNVSILGIRSKTRITKDIIASAPRLLTIGVFAIGVNQIDLKSATGSGISVFNAPYSNTRSVAELVIGEMIMLSRRTFEKSSQMHQGIWNKSALFSHEVRGRKLGIIGYGHIGSQVSVLAEALGMEVYFYNTSDRLAFGNAKKCDSMEEVLKIADILTIHVSGKLENKDLIAEKEFALMKDGVLFLNASRGFVVNIDALFENLKSGKVKGAAIDVFPKEPAGNGEFTTPLQDLSNVILTPHVGAGTEEAQRDIASYVPRKIIDYINSGNTDLSINIPNIQLPAQGDAHRLLHLHRNVPGVLAKINSILAGHKLNILGQYLKTNEDIGYVITDVNNEYDTAVLTELKKIPDTIKLRVLY